MSRADHQFEQTYARVLHDSTQKLTDIQADTIRPLSRLATLREWTLLDMAVFRYTFKNILIGGHEHVAPHGGQVFVIMQHPTALDGPLVQRTLQKISSAPIIAHTPMKNFAAFPLRDMMRARGDVLPFYEALKHGTLSPELIQQWHNFDQQALAVFMQKLREQRINMVIARGQLQNRGEAGLTGLKTHSRTFITALANTPQKNSMDDPVCIIPIAINSSSTRKVPQRARIQITAEPPQSPAAFLARFQHHAS